MRVAEDEASCEVFGLLKRPDEKWVTERAYDNPKFVEDLVRDIALCACRATRASAAIRCRARTSSRSTTTPPSPRSRARARRRWTDVPRGDTAGGQLRIAVVGSGIAGLGTAWLLQKQGHAVTVFEAAPRLGGHTHTVDVTLEGITHPVDTGFLVFNDRTYPNLIALFAELGVPSVATEMSFSVSDDGSGLEWAGTNLATLFAQTRNRVRPAFWSMLPDILRFNRETTAALAANRLPSMTLGAYLDAQRYRRRVSRLVPAADGRRDLVVARRGQMLDFPLPTFVRFCHNHGLLQVFDRPLWRTVKGGGRVYVQQDRRAPRRRAPRLPGAAGAPRPTAASRSTRRAAGRAFRRRRACLPQRPGAGAPRRPVTQTSAALLARFATSRTVSCCTATPRCCRATARLVGVELPGRRRSATGEQPVAVSYLINRLQPLPFRTPVIVTLNPAIEPDPRSVIDEFEYSHPAARRRGGDGSARRSRAARAGTGRGMPVPGSATASTRMDSSRPTPWQRALRRTPSNVAHRCPPPPDRSTARRDCPPAHRRHRAARRRAIARSRPRAG